MFSVGRFNFLQFFFVLANGPLTILDLVGNAVQVKTWSDSRQYDDAHLFNYDGITMRFKTYWKITP